MPGRLRWSQVASDVADRRPAAVAGTLYDTGRGYPALALNGAGGRVEGWLLGVADEDAAAVLDRLDRIEGPSYRRAPVTTTDGTEAVTYEHVGPRDGFVALDGVWDREDER